MRQTIFSPGRVYRYTLYREWAPGPYAMFICLNPSTADELKDDPTVRRCMGYARSWGLGALVMCNLFAVRATDPRVMKAHESPIGPFNDVYLGKCAESAALVMAAWGNHGSFQGRDEEVKSLIPNLQMLQRTAHGHPGHPLYLPKNLQPQPLQ